MDLDVGCSNNPKGDVNIDYRKGWNYEDVETGVFVDPHKISNFVLADAQYLPFRNKTFNHVNANYIIEHVPDPYKLLQELIRVSNKTIHIKCPHRFGPTAKSPHHKSFFTRRWFEQALKGLRYKMSTIYMTRIPIFRLIPFFGLKLPAYIEITIDVEVD